MSHWLCLLRGHQRAPVVFSTNRFYCRRCGLDLAPDSTPNPDPSPETALAVGKPAREDARERSRPALPAAGATSRTGKIR